MFHYCLLYLSLILSCLPSLVHSQAARIVVDGRFNDWQNLSPVYSDPSGDQQSGELDFGDLWISNDEQFLFMRLETTDQITMQDENTISLFIDADNNSSTGIQVHGIGAELEWVFGQRIGTFWNGGGSVEIHQSDIWIVTSPTVSAESFEIALKRGSQPDQQNQLFTGNTIKVVIKDNDTGNDRIPDQDGGIEYSFDDTTSLPELEHLSIGKSDSANVRVLSYNVLTDNLFEPSLTPAYTRILQALQPQLIGFQEIYSHDAQETLDMIEYMLPSLEEQQWYSSKILPDIVTVSRFPISDSWAIEGQNSSSFNGAFLIDLTEQFGTDLLFINAHPPCCDNDIGRQYEIDAIMAFIRDARAPGGDLTLPPGTPIIITGDMNLVRDAQQLTTLLTGQIINTDQFGPPFDPDWDNTPLADNSPRSINLPMEFTWYNEFSSFSPGRLDFIIHSDSVIDSAHSFVLFTPAMSPDTLDANNLEAQDVVLVSDHLPVVADFSFQPVGPSDYNVVITEIMPNPASVSDSFGEWFEVYNNDSNEIDLNGWTIKGNDSDYHGITGDPGTLSLSPGDYFVFGTNGDTDLNGGYIPDYVYSSFVMGNDDDSIILVDSQGFVVDVVEYTSSFPFDNGISIYLRGLEYENNQDTSWAASFSSYGDGDLGTPGKAWDDTLTTHSDIFVPDKFVLMQNFPNPFNPTTTIEFIIPTDQYVSLVIYDVQGRFVEDLISGRARPSKLHRKWMVSGTHSIEWDASHVASGVYFCRMVADGFVKTKKLMVIN